MDITFNLPPALVIGLIVSTVLPILTGLVTTRVTSGGTKAIILAALAAATGLGTELLSAVQAQVAYDLGTGLILALTAFLIGVAMHFGLWKPTSLSDKAQGVLVTAKVSPDGTADVSSLPPDNYQPRHEAQ
jgi:hypothetical protein